MASTGGTIDNPLGVSYSLLVGPLLIGVVVNALVFGVCVMQLVSYLMSGYRDGWRMMCVDSSYNPTNIDVINVDLCLHGYTQIGRAHV